MADYGWVYASCDAILTGASGETGSILFKTGNPRLGSLDTAWDKGTHLSGSHDFMYDTASNRVGIGLSGSDTPAAKLHVIGDVSITGTLYTETFRTNIL